MLNEVRFRDNIRNACTRTIRNLRWNTKNQLSYFCHFDPRKTAKVIKGTERNVTVMS